MSKKTKKKKRAVVRGPQQSLQLGRKSKPKEPQRTMRMRFIEPPGKKDGNPFFALRVPADVLKAFRRKTGSDGTSIVRAYIAKVAGVKLEAQDGDE